MGPIFFACWDSGVDKKVKPVPFCMLCLSRKFAFCIYLNTLSYQVACKYVHILCYCVSVCIVYCICLCSM